MKFYTRIENVFNCNCSSLDTNRGTVNIIFSTFDDLPLILSVPSPITHSVSSFVQRDSLSLCFWNIMHPMHPCCKRCKYLPSRVLLILIPILERGYTALDKESDNLSLYKMSGSRQNIYLSACYLTPICPSKTNLYAYFALFLYTSKDG